MKHLRLVRPPKEPPKPKAKAIVGRHGSGYMADIHINVFLPFGSRGNGAEWRELQDHAQELADDLVTSLELYGRTQ